jgi:hypothetical protein
LVLQKHHKFAPDPTSRKKVFPNVDPGFAQTTIGCCGDEAARFNPQTQKHILMEYMLIMTETAADFAKRNDPNQAPAYFGAWAAYVKAIAESGIMVSGLGLQPPETATTVRIRDGKRVLHDGPYAKAKEMLGSSSMCGIWMPPWNGLHARLLPRVGVWRCALPSHR